MPTSTQNIKHHNQDVTMAVCKRHVSVTDLTQQPSKQYPLLSRDHDHTFSEGAEFLLHWSKIIVISYSRVFQYLFFYIHYHIVLLKRGKRSLLRTS